VISPQTGQPQGRRHLRSPLPRSGARKPVRPRRVGRSGWYRPRCANGWPGAV